MSKQSDTKSGETGRKDDEMPVVRRDGDLVGGKTPAESPASPLVGVDGGHSEGGAVSAGWVPPSEHSPRYADCDLCAKSYRKRYPLDEAGLPLGEGGETCGTCGIGHVHGAPCSPTGLKANGWTRNGVDTKGRMRWLKPGVNRKVARRKRVRSASAERAKEVTPLEGFAATLGRKKAGFVAAGLKKIPPPEPRNEMLTRLDPQTYKPWLQVAKARMAGLTSRQISSALEIDPEFIERLSATPEYLFFEMEFRQAMASQPEMAAVQERLGRLMMDAVDALEYWVRKREDAMWSASLSAARQIMAANGVDTERKRVTTTQVRATLTPKQVNNLIEAVGRQGA